MNRNDPTDRFYFVPAFQTPICNECKHRDFTKCAAYPDGFTQEVITRKCAEKKAGIYDAPCNGVDDIRFEPIDPDDKKGGTTDGTG